MPLAVNWLDENVPAILEAWYPGQAGGTAITEALFGLYNPGGKLPVTFHRGVEDLPPLGDYDITKGRTYWFYEGDVLYPFGHGLSYTTFEFSHLEIDNLSNLDSNGSVKVTMDIRNTGLVKGDEVVQLYVKDLESDLIQPLKKLRDFKRVTLEPGEYKAIRFELTREDFSFWNEESNGWDMEPGEFEIQVGNSSRNILLKQGGLAANPQ